MMESKSPLICGLLSFLVASLASHAVMPISSRLAAGDCVAVGGAACAFNCAMLAVNFGFTNKHVERYDPKLFSKQGQFGVLVWGLAYAAAAWDGNGRAIWLAFAAEKLWSVVAAVQSLRATATDTSASALP